MFGFALVLFICCLESYFLWHGLLLKGSGNETGLSVDSLTGLRGMREAVLGVVFSDVGSLVLGLR
jgi:hypothetical protein